MRRLVGALCLSLSLLIPSQGWAVMALAQACVISGPVSATPTTIALGVAATAGNLITVQATHNQDTRSITGITDAGTTTYGVGPNVATDGAGGRAETWRGIAAGASAGTSVSVTFGGNPDTAYFCICEWTQAAADQSVATGNSGGATGASAQNHDVASTTPPTANNLMLVTMVHTNGSWTYDSDFTQIAAVSNAYFFGYMAQSAATAQPFNTTSAANAFSTIQVGAFAGTSGAAAETFGFRLRLQQ